MSRIRGGETWTLKDDYRVLVWGGAVGRRLANGTQDDDDVALLAELAEDVSIVELWRAIISGLRKEHRVVS